MLTVTDPEQCQLLLDILWKQSVTGLALVDQTGRFLRANPTFCRLTEYTEWELQHRTFQDITDPSDVEADVGMSKLVLGGDIETYDMTKCYITKTKGFLPILLRVTGMRMNEKFIYFVAEIAPLERGNSGLPVSPHNETMIRRVRFLQFIKNYWIQLVAIGSVILAAIDRVLSHVWKN